MNASRAHGAETQLWLVRHGETEWSAAGRHTSVTDLALTAAGEDAARRVRAELSDIVFAAVLTSPRRRARRTAELAGFPDAGIDDDLTEWAYGEYEGLTTAEIRASVPDWSVWTHDSPGGETARDVTERMDRLIERVRGTGGRTLVFAHGHSLRALAARWLGLEVREGRLFALDTATVSVLDTDRGVPVVRRWNAGGR